MSSACWSDWLFTNESFWLVMALSSLDVVVDLQARWSETWATPPGEASANAPAASVLGTRLALAGSCCHGVFEGVHLRGACLSFALP